MNNLEIISKILRLSKEIYPYIYVKGQLDVLYSFSEKHVKEKEALVSMKKSIDSLAIKIRLAKSKIFDLYTKMDGYKPEFNEIDYISTADIEDGYVPVDSGDTYLVLRTGEFAVVFDEGGN